VLEFNLMFLGVYKVHGTTKEEFVITIVHVNMQHRQLYIVHHTTRDIKVIITYQVKHNL